MISDNVKKRALCALGEFKDKYPDYEIALASISGSYSFGWAGPTSDVDIRGAYVVPTLEFASLREPPMTLEFKSEEYNVEFQMHEIKKFVGLMIQPNLNMLDAVYVEPELVLERNKAIYEDLRSLGYDSLSKAAFPHVQGLTVHMKKHRNKYNLYDPKKNLYIYRELMRGIVLFSDGKLINNISDLAEQLPDTKKAVDLLLKKKYDKEFLSDDERDFINSEEMKLETMMNNAKVYGTLQDRCKDDLHKRAEKMIDTLRLNQLKMERKL